MIQSVDSSTYVRTKPGAGPHACYRQATCTDRQSRTNRAAAVCDLCDVEMIDVEMMDSRWMDGWMDLDDYYYCSYVVRRLSPFCIIVVCHGRN